MTDGTPAQSANFRRKSAALHLRDSRVTTPSASNALSPSALNAEAAATNGAAAASASSKRKKFFSRG